LVTKKSVKDIKDVKSSSESPLESVENGENFELTGSRQFVSWLQEQNISLVFSTYQTGKVMMIGRNLKGTMSVFERTFERPMGLWSDGQTMLLSSLYQLHRFENSLLKGQDVDGYDRLYVPQVSYITGDLDIHDVALGQDGKPVFINTLFSCIATTSDTASFKILWKPSFIDALQPEDRCHLNGLAMRDGKPAYVTAISTTNVSDGWREHRRDGGVVIDVATDKIVAKGLSMPHSPRWHNDKLWVANSGAGEFGFINLDSGTFEPLVFVPGYIRGVSFHGDFAVIGLSRPRHNKSFEGLVLDERLAEENVRARSGIIVIDLKSGAMPHAIYAEGIVTELYDVAVLPGVVKPSMIGFRNDQVRRVLSIES
jgi:uncharacterized protein (TIGR03032 family)